jgi:hypothetical protein
MNNYADTNIDIIQYKLPPQSIAPIREGIMNLKENIKRTGLILAADDRVNLHITSRDLHPRSGRSKRLQRFPADFTRTVLAIQISDVHSYIEILSNGTVRQLEALIPQIPDPIAQVIREQTKIKHDKIVLEDEKLSQYAKICSETRKELSRPINPLALARQLPEETVREILCVPEHAFAISSFAKSVVLLGTYGLGSCIGLVVINPARKVAGVTHLDYGTIETYKSSLQAMFSTIVTPNDQCRLYLFGGATVPKEEAPPSTYEATLVSETLACSLMEVLKLYENKLEIVVRDMFHEKRPDAFAIRLDPDGAAEPFGISKDGLYELEYGDHDYYSENMIADDPTSYQELQQYSFDRDFKRLLAPALPPFKPKK